MPTTLQTNRTGTRLTRREKEILSCIAQGLSSKQIAGKLSLSEYTIANHRKNMLLKTGAKNSAELVQISLSRYN